MTSKKDNELHNLFTGDYLICKACGAIIYSAPLHPFTFRFAEVTRKFHNHLLKCFGLQRLVVRAHQEMRGLKPDFE